MGPKQLVILPGVGRAEGEASVVRQFLEATAILMAASTPGGLPHPAILLLTLLLLAAWPTPGPQRCCWCFSSRQSGVYHVHGACRYPWRSEGVRGCQSVSEGATSPETGIRGSCEQPL